MLHPTTPRSGLGFPISSALSVSQSCRPLQTSRPLQGISLQPLTQWSLKLCVITEEPKERAGLIPQPV